MMSYVGLVFDHNGMKPHTVKHSLYLADTLLLQTPHYYGHKLKSWGIRITENNSRYYTLSLLRTPNLDPDGVC